MTRPHACIGVVRQERKAAHGKGHFTDETRACENKLSTGYRTRVLNGNQHLIQSLQGLQASKNTVFSAIAARRVHQSTKLLQNIFYIVDKTEPPKKSTTTTLFLLCPAAPAKPPPTGSQDTSRVLGTVNAFHNTLFARTGSQNTAALATASGTAPGRSNTDQ